MRRFESFPAHQFLTVWLNGKATACKADVRRFNSDCGLHLHYNIPMLKCCSIGDIVRLDACDWICLNCGTCWFKSVKPNSDYENVGQVYTKTFLEELRKRRINGEKFLLGTDPEVEELEILASPEPFK